MRNNTQMCSETACVHLQSSISDIFWSDKWDVGDFSTMFMFISESRSFTLEQKSAELDESRGIR